MSAGGICEKYVTFCTGLRALHAHWFLARPWGVFWLVVVVVVHYYWNVTVSDIMPTLTSQTRRPQQGLQLTRRRVTRKSNTGSWPSATSLYQSSSHRISRDLEPPSSGICAGAGQTNDSRH